MAHILVAGELVGEEAERPSVVGIGINNGNLMDIAPCGRHATNELTSNAILDWS